MKDAKTGKTLAGKMAFIVVCLLFLGYAILAGVSAVDIPTAKRAEAACDQVDFSPRQRLDCEMAARERLRRRDTDK